MEYMSLNILKELSTLSPTSVYIEQTYTARNPQTTQTLTMIQGVVYGWCITNNCKFNTIRPTQWRKAIGIKQSKLKRAQLKELSIKYVLEKYKLEVSDDIADAICIGEAATILNCN